MTSLRATIGGLERTLELEPLPFTIGRRPSHSLSIPLPQISRDHAQIIADDGGFVLNDQESTHGTLVNRARVRRQKLTPGDVIEFPNCPGVKIVFDPASCRLSMKAKLPMIPLLTLAVHPVSARACSRTSSSPSPRSAPSVNSSIISRP